MFDAAIPSEALDGTLQDADAAVRAKYVPADWEGYDPLSWAANWHRWFSHDATDARGKMGWPDYFTAAIGNATEVYNYYSDGDAVFAEDDEPPGLLSGVFHWPTLSLSWPFVRFSVTAEVYCWQKQETLKGLSTIAGTMSGGWGFHCWAESLLDDLRMVKYQPLQANDMVTDGSITNNPVFNRDFTPMFDACAAQDDQWYALAKCVPAISSPVGGRIVEGDTITRNMNLNENTFRNGWGRPAEKGAFPWKHSDMKDMSYYYVYRFFGELLERTEGGF